MSAQITKHDVTGAYKRVANAMARLTGRDSFDYELEVWAPGDGKTRYRLNWDKGSRHLTSSYWLGRSEAYRGLHAIAEALEHVENAKTETTAQGSREP